MSKHNRKIDSKEVGLEIGLILSKYFLDTEYLHYGLFKDHLPVEVKNLAQAQINYAEFLKSNIPAGVRYILDVGCGSGRFALELINAGYNVDCVSPGTILTEHAKKLLGDRSQIFNCKFENLTTEKKYDMILFSESFQYINMDASFTNAIKFLNPGGYIMLCDFFKTDPENKSMLGGGHDYNEFLNVLKKYPLTTVKEQDITQETAPTIDLVNKLSMEVLQPIYRLLFLLLEDRFPLVAKFVKWKYKKKLLKIENKHFKGERNGANFMKYKKYMFYLFKLK
ncbi:MAG: class I SAM-dependent methyltransferase [Cytophagaceae bacterium]|nr:class I SAM-dependent methyltransferase [Cytophagaceae bacterium]MDW8455660.1 class I SAM-dependent methyltransferase [Cytophagaceae bacterium]